MKTILTKATPNSEETKRELENRQLARKVAAESIVLLQNDGTLPIAPKRIALYGAGAATTIKGGTGSGEVNERYSVTIEQGLKNAGFDIGTDAWLREYESNLIESKGQHNKAVVKKLVRSNADDRINIMADSFQYPIGRAITEKDILDSKTDTCIYVIARQAGECSDRSLLKGEYNLTEDEIENIKIAAKEYDNTIVVVNIGAQFDLSPLDEIPGIGALIFFCQQGMEGGNAFADIITGKVSPSGAFSSTWAKRYEDIPHAMEYSYLKGHTDFEEYKEGIYVGYRYFDSFNVAPRYPFGYGLSYTDFRIDFVKGTVDKAAVAVSANITNIGDKYAGKKMVQLYVSAPNGKLNREYQSLVAFTKTSTLNPGESEQVNLTFDLTDIAGYDEENASFILEKGDYLLRLGENAVKTTTIAVITLDDDVVTEVCENICKAERDFEEIMPKALKTEVEESEAAKPETLKPEDIESEALKLEDVESEALKPEVVESEAAKSKAVKSEVGSEDLPHFTINSSDIITITHSYALPPTKLDSKVQNLLQELSLDDMIKVVVGTGVMGADYHFKTLGAAGHTTSLLVDKGIPNVSLCDGPAGVRVQRTSVKYKNGKIKPVDAMIEIMSSLPWFARKLMFGNPKKGSPLYQYASAFPVGTALAQTWNISLIEEVGKAIGVEMDEFGGTFWLGPGMNIHRNPLCGRNFEYFSEDPILTGKMAAAITKGVQSLEGIYATIKHYAANNQEMNRNRSNSKLSERTLREIYLKGFRIAVQEGKAKSVMTSYNLINGTYAPASYDLCTKVLRCEWGFDGVVMTDWFSTGKGLASNGKTIKAGNDLIMPGGKSFIKSLKEDLEGGLVTEDEIRLCCGRVLESALKSRLTKEL